MNPKNPDPSCIPSSLLPKIHPPHHLFRSLRQEISLPHETKLLRLSTSIPPIANPNLQRANNLLARTITTNIHLLQNHKIDLPHHQYPSPHSSSVL